MIGLPLNEGPMCISSIGWMPDTTAVLFMVIEIILVFIEQLQHAVSFVLEVLPNSVPVQLRSIGPPTCA